MSNIYQKLAKARVELQDMKLKKSGQNQNIKYYELGDFLPAVNALGEKHGFITQFTIETKESYLDGEKPMVIESAVLRVIDTEVEGEVTNMVTFISPTADVELPRGQKIQGLGAKITYMRRYMLMVAFEIVESDMVDSINRELASEITNEELEKITKAKDFAELTKVCGALKTKYKVELIQPHYEKRKEELEDKVIKKPAKEEETK